MNGNDYKDNLVNLTAREHFIAHILLVKIYPKEHGLIKAVNMMTVKSEAHSGRKNRLYGWLKERFSKEMSRIQKGEKNSQFGTMWISNIKLKQSKKVPKDSELSKGWIKGRNKWNSFKICKNCKKEFFSEKTNFCNIECNYEYRRERGLMVSLMKGKKISEETSKKISESNKRRTGIKYKKRTKKIIFYKCLGCNKELQSNENKPNKFCSRECAGKYYQSGTIWIHNLEEKLTKKIKKEELQNYEGLGWTKGRKMKFNMTV